MSAALATIVSVIILNTVLTHFIAEMWRAETPPETATTGKTHEQSDNILKFTVEPFNLKPLGFWLCE